MTKNMTIKISRNNSFQSYYIICDGMVEKPFIQFYFYQIRLNTSIHVYNWLQWIPIIRHPFNICQTKMESMPKPLEYVNENRLLYCNRRVGFAANPNKYGVVLSDTKLMFSSSLRWCSLVSLDNQNKIIFSTVYWFIRCSSGTKHLTKLLLVLFALQLFGGSFLWQHCQSEITHKILFL